jgi:hypothetical protein
MRKSNGMKQLAGSDWFVMAVEICGKLGTGFAGALDTEKSGSRAAALHSPN